MKETNTYVAYGTATWQLIGQLLSAVIEWDSGHLLIPLATLGRIAVGAITDRIVNRRQKRRDDGSGGIEDKASIQANPAKSI